MRRNPKHLTTRCNSKNISFYLLACNGSMISGNRKDFGKFRPDWNTPSGQIRWMWNRLPRTDLGTLGTSPGIFLMPHKVLIKRTTPSRLLFLLHLFFLPAVPAFQKNSAISPGLFSKTHSLFLCRHGTDPRLKQQCLGMYPDLIYAQANCSAFMPILEEPTGCERGSTKNNTATFRSFPCLHIVSCIRPESLLPQRWRREKTHWRKSAQNP